MSTGRGSGRPGVRRRGAARGLIGLPGLRAHPARPPAGRPTRAGRRAAGRATAAAPGQRQPGPEREQDRGHHQVEDLRAGQQFDPDDGSGDHARQRPGDQQPGQRATGLPLPPVAVQRTGGGDHVVQQVGRGDGGTWRAQDADLERQQQHRARRSLRASRAGRRRRPRPARQPPSSRSRAPGHGSGQLTCASGVDGLSAPGNPAGPVPAGFVPGPVNHRARRPSKCQDGRDSPVTARAARPVPCRG